MGSRIQTDFLFARPSFLSGLARVLDVFGTFDSYNESRSGDEADIKAMFADWRITGQDLQDQIVRYKKELQRRQITTSPNQQIAV